MAEDDGDRQGSDRAFRAGAAPVSFPQCVARSLVRLVRPSRKRRERRARLDRRLALIGDATGGALQRVRVGLACELEQGLVVFAKTVLQPMDHIDVERVARETDQALELWEREGWHREPASFHRTPPALPEVGVEVARAGGLRYQHVRFESGFEPHPESPGRERWLSYRRNLEASARILRHPGEPRPWVVCVHGSGMGHPRLDFAAFRARWLHQVLGLNVALPVLPLSGPRRLKGVRIGFPTPDTLDNVHGVAQSLWDIRRLLSWIRAQGGETIGLQGVSLGGYTAALLSAFEPDLDCVIAGVPAADFSDLFEHHHSEAFLERHRKLIEGRRHLHHVVSPLTFPSRVPHERRFIYGGIADRMAHPIHQVERLWKHWSRPTLHWYEGPHVGLFWSKEVMEFVEHALAHSGVHLGSHDLEVDTRRDDEFRA
jgi:hypothetical protein